MLDFKPTRKRSKHKPARRGARKNVPSRRRLNPATMSAISATVNPNSATVAQQPRVGERISIGAFALTAVKAVCVLLAAWLVLGLGVESVTLWHSPLRKVEISGNRSTGSRELIAAAGISQGQALGEIDPFTIAARLSALPKMESADARRVFPGHLIITVQEREPAAIVQVSPGARVLIDKTGRVLARAPEELPAPMRALPRIAYAAPHAAPGSQLAGRRLVQALVLLANGERFGLGPGEEYRIDLNRPAALVLHLPKKNQQVILPIDDIQRALRVYPSLAAAIEAEFPHMRIIDLRAVEPAHGGRAFLRR